MPPETETELQNFHEFVAGQLQGRAANLSPEQVLAMWRERRETIASVRRGLDDLDAGRVKPAAEVLERLGRDAE
jgi:predicted transcriptional regulator